MIGRKIKARVFLEGVEIKNVYKVTVQTAIGTPSVAEVQLPPVEEFFERYE